MSATPLRVGDWAKDTATGRVGRIVEIAGRDVYLNAETGRDDWVAASRALIRASATQEIMAKVHAYNQLNRGRL